MDSSEPPSSSPDTAAVARAKVDAVVRATFDTAPDGLVVLDPQNRQIAHNASFAAMWGFPPDMLARNDTAEMRAFAARQLRNPIEYTEGLAQLRLIRQSTTLQEIELLDGRALERHVSPLDAAGFPGTLIVRWRDVTERRRAARALLEATTRLAAVFDHARNAILLANDQGGYVDANPAACELLGRSLPLLRTLTVAEVLDLPEADAAAIWHAFLQQGTASGEITLRRPDGSTRQARFEAVANIQSGLHLSVMTDVTEEVRARQQQLEATAQLETAMANAEIVFWVVDLQEDRVSAANPDWLQQTLGYTHTDLSESLMAWDNLVHPDDVARRENAWQAHVQGLAPSYQAEFRMRHKDGRWIWLQARGKAVARDARGVATRVVGTRIDITRRKQAERLLQQQAFTDSLTGTLNRRRFLELASIELERSRRHRQPIALLMIDLDHFKAINDTHGHAAGDRVLQAFVQAASTVMRSSDLFCRMGGEEFAALLPQTERDGALALGERLCDTVRAQPVELPGGSARYAVSIGITTLTGEETHTRSLESLLLAADKALYAAKRSGRDQVRLAEPG
jgi:diguanylate cyclase (GGDEF)-like protein/PAS domain S-box-containing protein